MLLQCSELARLHLLVQEAQGSDSLVQRCISLHSGKFYRLEFVSPAFLGDEAFSHFVLFPLSRAHFRECRKRFLSDEDVVQGRVGVFHPVQQVWGVSFQLEPVRGLYQCHFFTWDDVLVADVAPQDAQYFFAGQFAAFPRFVLFHRAVLRRTLVAEPGNQCNGLVVMFLESLVCFNLVQVFFQPILELAVFRHRFFRDFLM